MRETPVAVAIVGCAHIHVPRFVEMLSSRDDVVVPLLWDHDQRRASSTAAALDAEVAEDVARIWADDRIPAVVICSETVNHPELVMAAAGARKHLFVEKPLASTGRDAWESAAAIRAAGVMFSTGFFLRGRATHRFLRDEIAAGSFGSIMRMEASVAHAGALAGWFDDEWRWMADPKLAGFGAFGDMGSHAVDLILWLLGHPSGPVEIGAWTRATDGSEDAVDELGHAEMAFADGLHVGVTGSWLDLADPMTLRISGTDAHAAVIDGRLWYQRGDHKPDDPVALEKLPAELPHAFELFLDAVVEGNGRELVSPAQAARCVTIIETCYEAARSGRWVRHSER